MFEVTADDFHSIMFIHSHNLCFWFDSFIISQQAKGCACLCFGLFFAIAFFVHVLCDVMYCDATIFVAAQNREKDASTLVTWRSLVENPTSNWYVAACACLRYVCPSALAFFVHFMCDVMSCDTTAFVRAQNRRKNASTLVTWCSLVDSPINKQLVCSSLCMFAVYFPFCNFVFVSIFVPRTKNLNTSRPNLELWLLP